MTRFFLKPRWLQRVFVKTSWSSFGFISGRALCPSHFFLSRRGSFSFYDHPFCANLVEMSEQVFIYDTTLRDGAQTEGVTFSLSDKIKIALKLDELGIHYIEGGYPGSNPKDRQFFSAIKKEKLKTARIAAFGMTRKRESRVDRDPILTALLEAETQVVTVVGKTWDFHVTHVLKTSLDENLKMIEESVSFLKKHNREVLFDAEHFFDGYKKNPQYALKAVKAAEDGGADWIVLCDTNGGSLPSEVATIVKKTRQKISTRLGIHAHNDSEVAVANSLAAVEEGARQVQGTINGIGERCGNANLVSIIPNLQIKRGFRCIPPEALERLRSASMFVYEIANITPVEQQPFVGDKAFVHKGGMHVHAVIAHPETYEHIRPEWVGNRRRVLVSELSGRSGILYKAEEMGIKNLQEDQLRKILDAVKEKENQGFQYEGAEGSLWLLMKRLLNDHQSFFRLEGFRLVVDKTKDGWPYAEATIKVEVNGQREHTAAEGDGPVNALDNALRKALEPYYPQIKDIHLTDFKVRVLDAKEGTAAKVRVLIETRDRNQSWTTIGVSENIIEASWQALVDSIEFGLFHRKMQKKSSMSKRKRKALG